MCECPICYEELKLTNITTTSCGHKFHTSCLINNVKYNKSECPYCRANLLSELNINVDINTNTNIIPLSSILPPREECYTSDEVLNAIKERNIPIERLEPKLQDLIKEIEKQEKQEKQVLDKLNKINQ